MTISKAQHTGLLQPLPPRFDYLPPSQSIHSSKQKCPTNILWYWYVNDRFFFSLQCDIKQILSRPLVYLTPIKAVLKVYNSTEHLT